MFILVTNTYVQFSNHRQHENVFILFASQKNVEYVFSVQQDTPVVPRVVLGTASADVPETTNLITHGLKV